MLHVREETCGSQRKAASSNGVITARNTAHASPSRLQAFCTVCGITVPSTVESFHHRPSEPGKPGRKRHAAIKTVQIIVTKPTIASKKSFFLFELFKRSRMNIWINYNGHRGKEVGLVPIKVMDRLSKVVFLKKGERQISNNTFTLFCLCAPREPVRRKRRVSKQITVSWRSAGFFSKIPQYSLYLLHEKNPGSDLNSITVSLHFSKSKANKSDMTTWRKEKKTSRKAPAKEDVKKEQQWKKNGTDVNVVKSLAEAGTRRQKPENRFSPSSLSFSL